MLKTNPLLKNKILSMKMNRKPDSVFVYRLRDKGQYTDNINYSIVFNFRKSNDAHNFKLPTSLKKEYKLAQRVYERSYIAGSIHNYYRTAHIKEYMK